MRISAGYADSDVNESADLGLAPADAACGIWDLRNFEQRQVANIWLK